MHRLLRRACRQVLLTSACLHARRLSVLPPLPLSAPPPRAHRVTSYNVLSSHLADPAYFSHCRPEFLDAGYRFDLLLKKMDREVDQKAIICLQEVSADWAGKLHTYFAQHDYHFVTALYGNKFDGYMGVGMAFSREHYELQHADIKRLVDTKQNAPKPIFTPRAQSSPPSSLSLPARLRAFVSRLLQPTSSSAPPAPSSTISTAPSTASPPSPPSPDMIWSEVMRRKNEMISLQLTCKSSSDSFYVGTYHMPCVFRVPEVMAIHAALAAQHLHRLASTAPTTTTSAKNLTPFLENNMGEVAGDYVAMAGASSSISSQASSLADLVAASSVEQPPSPSTSSPTSRPSSSSAKASHHSGRVLPYILAGDFNIKPESSVYHLLTTGCLPVACPERIEPSKPGDTWTTHTNPLRSAYMLANQREPDFTNHARIRDTEPFIDTLDYVFLSPGWGVQGVEPIPHRDSVQGPYPTREEGSDHVLIAANVVLQHAEEP